MTFEEVYSNLYNKYNNNGFNLIVSNKKYWSNVYEFFIHDNKINNLQIKTLEDMQLLASQYDEIRNRKNKFDVKWMENKLFEINLYWQNKYIPMLNNIIEETRAIIISNSPRNYHYDRLTNITEQEQELIRLNFIQESDLIVDRLTNEEVNNLTHDMISCVRMTNNYHRLEYLGVLDDINEMEISNHNIALGRRYNSIEMEERSHILLALGNDEKINNDQKIIELINKLSNIHKCNKNDNIYKKDCINTNNILKSIENQIKILETKFSSCKTCKNYNNNPVLKCAVNPYVVNTIESRDCGEYEML